MHTISVHVNTDTIQKMIGKYCTLKIRQCTQHIAPWRTSFSPTRFGQNPSGEGPGNGGWQGQGRKSPGKRNRPTHRHQLMGSLSNYLQGFIHPRWCRISFINSTTQFAQLHRDKNKPLQVEPGKPGAEVSKKKNYKSKKQFAYRMCARRPTSAMPKPFLCCERAFCCSMVVMWPVLMHVMSFDVVVMSFDAMWYLVLCHVTWCNAMWCDVRSCDLMRCDCLCCVMSRDAMRCHVMCAHVMSCHLLCPAMGWNVMSLRCHWLWGHVVCSKWFCDDVVIQSTIQYSVLQSTTLVLQSAAPVLPCTTKYYCSTILYCKVLLKYYSVLHSTTLYYNVLLQYYSVLHSTTTYYKVLLQYSSVLHSTTTHYSSTTLYYKVLLQYYSVVHSTTTYYSSTTL